ncbi:MAG: hypothetical protein HOP19_08985 [Acidobacteria bacterium]|nr:hypothetical protein [Acidobacteriota bacterium]
MSKKIVLLTGCLLLLVVLSAALSFSNKADKKALASAALPPGQAEVTAKNLQSDTGEVVVFLEEAKVNATTPQRLDGYSCSVRNASGKSIKALTLLWIFRTINNGTESGISERVSFNSLVHPDLRESGFGRPLEPEQTIPLNAGTITKWDKARFLRAEVSVEYVEFEDGMKLGEDHNKIASSKLQQTREGAEKYKQWLKTQYLQKGKSVDALLEILQGAGMPPDLAVSPGGEMSGAQMYRKALLSLMKSGKGQDFANKHLN